MCVPFFWNLVHVPLSIQRSVFYYGLKCVSYTHCQAMMNYYIRLFLRNRSNGCLILRLICVTGPHHCRTAINNAVVPLWATFTLFNVSWFADPHRNRGICSSLPALMTVMSTRSCLPKSCTEHLQTMASASRCLHASTHRRKSFSILISRSPLGTSFL